MKNKIILALVILAPLSVFAAAPVEKIECREKFGRSDQTMSIEIQGDSAVMSAYQSGDAFLEDVEMSIDGKKYSGETSSGETVGLKIPKDRTGEFKVSYMYIMEGDESDHAGDWSTQSGCTSSISHAAAGASNTFKCSVAGMNDDGFGQTLTAVVSKKSITLKQTAVGTVHGSLDASYRPTPKHKGAIRFSGSFDSGLGGNCDSVEIILDQAMASGSAGRMTLVSDCDSDGTGPTFMNYFCK